MNGMEEKQNGDSFRLKDTLKIGKQYSTDDIARILQKHPNALSQTGVFHGAGSDCFVIFVTLNKEKDKTPYQDHFFEPSSLLFWEGQTKMRIAEDSFDKGYDCHAFVREFSRMPYTYYGRAVPIRQHRNNPGIPSQFVLYLPDYDDYKHVLLGASVNTTEEYFAGATEKQTIQTVRTKQADYRKNVIALWHGQCAVTGVDETSWLIASHIKPWRESTSQERTDPKNALLLSPNYDKLFDRGVISFNPSNGKIILPESMSHTFWRNLDRLGIDDEKTLAFIPDGTEKYLEYHKELVFGFTPSADFDADELVAEMLQSV